MSKINVGLIGTAQWYLENEEPEKGKSSSWCYKSLNFCQIDMKLGIYIYFIDLADYAFSKVNIFKKVKIKKSLTLRRQMKIKHRNFKKTKF